MKHKKDTAVVYIITHLELGGAQKVCLTLFNGMESQGITTYLCAGNEGILSKKLAPSPHIFLLDSLRRAVGFKSVIQEVKAFFTLLRILRTIKRKHGHVVVHTHSTKAGILGRWAAFFARIHTRIHTIHGFSFHPHQKRLTWFAHYVAELITSFITSHFVCVSSADVKTGVHLFPRFARKHSIIRAAVDWNQFYKPAYKASVFPEQEFIFGTISCFKHQKNIFDLLKAFEQTYTLQRSARLELIGDGILRPEIETWIAARGLQSVITLHGWQEHVAPFMMEWHAFVLSSLWEGLPCAIVEARLLRLPVLAYDTGGIHDVITHGENGFLYKQGDWHSLAQGMLTLVENKTMYQTLRNHKDTLSDFNDTYMVDQHKELYFTSSR